jgi:hypothetical protein
VLNILKTDYMSVGTACCQVSIFYLIFYASSISGLSSPKPLPFLGEHRNIVELEMHRIQGARVHHCS